MNARDLQGQTPLLIAVAYKNLEITKLLIEKGANVNVKDHEGESALVLGIGNNGAG